MDNKIAASHGDTTGAVQAGLPASEVSADLQRFDVRIVDVQALILKEIADPKIKRDSVALTYGFCIKQREEVDFKVINAAIIARWSMSGLTYIKTKAWGMFK